MDLDDLLSMHFHLQGNFLMWFWVTSDNRVDKGQDIHCKKKKLHVSEKNVAGFLFIFSTLIFTLEKTFRFVFVDRKFWRQVYVNFNFKPSSTPKNLVKFLSTPFSLHFEINNYFLRQKKVIKLIHKHHQIFWNINKIYSFFFYG